MRLCHIAICLLLLNPLSAFASSISGSVLDAQTGQPVPGARVEAVGTFCCPNYFAVKPDAEGHFVFPDLPGNDYTVSVTTRDSEYVPQTWPEVIHVTGPDVAGIDFRMQQGGGISGRVVDEQGAPVSGLTVWISNGKGGNPYTETLDNFFVTTGHDGTYATHRNLPATPFAVRTTDENVESDSEFPVRKGYSGVLYDNVPCWTICDPEREGIPVVPQAGQTLTGIDFVVKPLGKARGRVLDAVTGRPIPAGWRVYARGRYLDSFMFAEEGVIGARGEYAVQVGDGGATVTASFLRSDPAYLTASRTGVFVPPGRTDFGYDILVTPAGARVRGRVTDAQSGRPAADILVTIVDPNGSEVQSVPTASDGTYETLPSLHPGTYSVRTTAGGAWTAQTSAPIALDGTQIASVDVQLHRMAAVAGIVRDAVTRQPLAGARVQLVAEDGVIAASDVTGAEGRYAVPAQAGSYLARVVKGGWQADSRQVTVRATIDDVTAADFALAPSCVTSLTAAPTAFSAAGGTGRLTLTGTCQSCTFGSASFIHLPGLCGTGDVTFTIDANPGTARTGWIVVPGGTLQIEQEGRRSRSVGH
jgi:5-hydroxyisourate hydrolase-like protein (transthyretin family)